jgi:hypothetical protein
VAIASVDVEYGLSANASVQQSIDRGRMLAPSRLPRHLAVEAPIQHEPTQPGEVT